MAKVTVEEFATDLKLGVDKLIEQLSAAGVTKALKPETALTEADKRKLLDYLKQSSGGDKPRTKIMLTRRQTSEI
jgi:translation initiation factor IF-2